MLPSLLISSEILLLLRHCPPEWPVQPALFIDQHMVVVDRVEDSVVTKNRRGSLLLASAFCIKSRYIRNWAIDKIIYLYQNKEYCAINSYFDHVSFYKNGENVFTLKDLHREQIDSNVSCCEWAWCIYSMWKDDNQISHISCLTLSCDRGFLQTLSRSVSLCVFCLPPHSAVFTALARDISQVIGQTSNMWWEVHCQHSLTLID